MKHNATSPEELYERTLINSKKSYRDGYKFSLYKLLYDDDGFPSHWIRSMESIDKKLHDENFLEHKAKKATYYWKKTLPKKDNTSSYTGNDGYSSKIRVPSLKRKTAWKRFYKANPDLVGLDHIIGRSQGVGVMRDSFIKLKKLKHGK